MLTKKQANTLRGKLTYLLEVADDYAHAGAQRPEDAQYIREEYRRVKRDYLDALIDLTKPEVK